MRYSKELSFQHYFANDNSEILILDKNNQGQEFSDNILRNTVNNFSSWKYSGEDKLTKSVDSSNVALHDINLMADTGHLIKVTQELLNNQEFLDKKCKYYLVDRANSTIASELDLTMNEDIQSFYDASIMYKRLKLKAGKTAGSTEYENVKINNDQVVWIDKSVELYYVNPDSDWTTV